MCYVAFGQPSYSNNFCIDKTKFNIKTKLKEIVQLSIQEQTIYSTAYICYGYMTDPRGNEQPTKTYKLMQGLNSDEIILLKTIEESQYVVKCEPIGLIKNVNKFYINLMFYGYNF